MTTANAASLPATKPVPWWNWTRMTMLGSALALGGLSFVGAYVVERHLNARGNLAAHARVASMARSAEQYMLRTLSTATGLLDLGERWLLATEGRPAQDDQAMPLLTLMATGTNSGFNEIFLQTAIAGPRGEMLYSTIGGNYATTSIADREHFRVHLDNPQRLFIGEPVVGRVSARRSIQISRGVTSEQALLGVVVVSLDPDEIASAYRAMTASRTENFLVFRQTGEVLANTMDLGPRRASYTHVSPELIRAFQQAPEGSVRSIWALTGRDRFLAYKNIAGTDLAVAASLTADEELQDARDFSKAAYIAAGSLAACFLAIALAFVFLSKSREERAGKKMAARWNAQTQRMLGRIPAIIFQGVVTPDGKFTATTVHGDTRSIAGQDVTPVNITQIWANNRAENEPYPNPAFFGDVLSNGTADLDYSQTLPDGRQAAHRISVRKLESASPSLGSADVVGHVLDVTHEQEALAKAMATSRIQNIGEMASGIAHETVQPLSAIVAAADNLDMTIERCVGSVPQPVQECIDSIMNYATRALAIIRHMQAFSRPDNDTIRGPVNVADAIVGAISTMTGPLNGAGITVLTFQNGIVPLVIGNQIGLETVIINLLSNASHAIQMMAQSDPDHPKTVTITTTGKGDTVEIKVTDTGGGIPSHLLHRIFEPLFTTKPLGRGTGLGLTNCRKWVEKWGGSINAANVPGNGASFTITLPKAPN